MVKVRHCLWVALLGCAATQALGAVIAEEDLSGCKLPNGISVLPAPHTPAATNGELLKISTGGMVTFPAPQGGQVETVDQLGDRLRASKAADLEYLPDNEGTFWAVSGAISDLGLVYLSDAAAMKADPPLEIRATSRSAGGMLPGIAEGHTYLLKTSESHYALLRVLEKSQSGVVIQYVYQPLGSMVFDVPVGDKLKYQRPGGVVSDAAASEPAATTTPGPLASLNPVEPAGGGGGLTIPPRPATTLPAPMPKPPLGPEDVNQPGVIRLLSHDSDPKESAATLELSMDTFAKQRDQMIKRRVAIVEAPTHNGTEVEKKAQAIADLASLHADEAADVLVQQIVFLNPNSAAKEFTQEAFHPCVAALHSLGKSGTVAALKGLKELDVDAATDGLDTPGYRAELLGIVVRAVEGDDIGNLLLKQEMEKETDPRRRALYERAMKKTTPSNG